MKQPKRSPTRAANTFNHVVSKQRQHLIIPKLFLIILECPQLTAITHTAGQITCHIYVVCILCTQAVILKSEVCGLCLAFVGYFIQHCTHNFLHTKSLLIATLSTTQLILFFKYIVFFLNT